MKFKIIYLALAFGVLGMGCKSKVPKKGAVLEYIEVDQIPSLPEYNFSIALEALEDGNTEEAIAYVNKTIADIELQTKISDNDEFIESSDEILVELNSISKRMKNLELVSADELESELMVIENAFPSLVLINDTVIEIDDSNKLVQSLKSNIAKLTAISKKSKGKDLVEANKLLAGSKRYLKRGEQNIMKWEKEIGAHLKVAEDWIGRHLE